MLTMIRGIKQLVIYLNTEHAPDRLRSGLVGFGEDLIRLVQIAFDQFDVRGLSQKLSRTVG